MNKYVQPQKDLDAFNCPYCGAYASMTWNYLSYFGYSYCISALKTATCSRCQKDSLWLRDEMVIPSNSTAPMPSDDMPEDIKQVYNEAREIVSKSPKGGCALLRLALQMLCDNLVPQKHNINEQIAELVRQGLSPQLQKAFDLVRIVGNNAVHPGEINIDDNPQIAIKLFGLINMIVEKMITEPKQISSFYDKTMPESTKKAIEKRDAN